ncbi:MAG: type II toxin-antitoxin system ParD family antitoxin [Pirellulales bacterium]
MTSVSLPSELTAYLNQEVASGRYASPSDVVVEAVRMHREIRDQYEQLRAQVQEAVAQADRGELRPLDVEWIKAEGRRRLSGG